MNLGKVVYVDEQTADERGYRGTAADTDIRENLQYGPAPQTKSDFSDEGCFSHLVELCNGCGTCRETDLGGDVPDLSRLRGGDPNDPRANMLRAAISGALDDSESHSVGSKRRCWGSVSTVRGVKAISQPASTSRSSKLR